MISERFPVKHPRLNWPKCNIILVLSPPEHEGQAGMPPSCHCQPSYLQQLPVVLHISSSTGGATAIPVSIATPTGPYAILQPVLWCHLYHTLWCRSSSQHVWPIRHLRWYRFLGQNVLVVQHWQLAQLDWPAGNPVESQPPAEDRPPCSCGQSALGIIWPFLREWLRPAPDCSGQSNLCLSSQWVFMKC